MSAHDPSQIPLSASCKHVHTQAVLYRHTLRIVMVASKCRNLACLRGQECNTLHQSLQTASHDESSGELSKETLGRVTLNSAISLNFPSLAGKGIWRKPPFSAPDKWTRSPWDLMCPGLQVLALPPWDHFRSWLATTAARSIKSIAACISSAWKVRTYGEEPGGQQLFECCSDNRMTSLMVSGTRSTGSQPRNWVPSL